MRPLTRRSRRPLSPIASLNCIGLASTLWAVQTQAAEDTPARGDELATIIVATERLPDVYSGGQVARGSRLGLIGNRDVMETPFSTVNYTSQYLKDTGARSLSEVLVADPSVRLSGSTSRSFDRFQIRGFRFNNSSVTFDGLNGVAPPLQIAVETVERVELIKGPTALLTGMSPAGEIGGSINVAPKRAGATPNLNFTGTYYSESELGAHVDAGSRFGSDQQFGVRFNGVYRDGDLSLDNNSRKTIDATIGLDFISGRFRLSSDFGYQERNNQGLDADHYLAAGVFELPRAPGAGDAHFQPWSSQLADATYGSVRAQYELSDNALVYAAGGFGQSESRLIGSYAMNVTADGNFMETFWGTATDFDSVSAETGFRTVLNTGAVQHQIALAAMRLDRDDKNLSVFTPGIVGGLTARPSNLYSPVSIERPTNFGAFPTVRKTGETRLTSFGAADTLSFAEGRTLLTLGARLQRVEVQAFNATSGVRTSTYDEEALSPAAAVVFKARSDVSVYANYSQGLSQGQTAPGTAINAGEQFEPYKTKQIEAGVKMDRGTYMASLAVFQIAQPSGITDPVTRVFGVDGEERHRGIELNTYGEPLRGLRLLGGLTLMEAELTRTAGGTNNGRTAVGNSKVAVSLGGEWDAAFLSGLTFSVRGVYSGPFYVDAANRIEAPSWKTFDIGARYAFKAGDNPVVLRLNVENAFDENYWNGSNLYRGGARTVLFSGSLDL